MSHRDIDFDWTLCSEWSVVRGVVRARKKPAQSTSSEAVAAEIVRLSGLTLGVLRFAWAAEFRRQPPKGLWRDLLLRTLAGRLQEKVFGGHDKATLRLLEATGQGRAGDRRCRRLKAGTVLVRDLGVRDTPSPSGRRGLSGKKGHIPASPPSPGTSP